MRGSITPRGFLGNRFRDYGKLDGGSASDRRADEVYDCLDLLTLAHPDALWVLELQPLGDSVQRAV